MEDAEQAVLESHPHPVLIQVTADWCALCVGFNEAIEAIHPHYDFVWLIADAADTELTAAYNITKLPAFLLLKKGQLPIVRAAASQHDLNSVIKEECQPRLKLDEDF